MLPDELVLELVIEWIAGLELNPYPVSGCPFLMTSVVTATMEQVILEKSMKALAIREAIGTVFSRISVMRMSYLAFSSVNDR
jgi:hypothetical protein